MSTKKQFVREERKRRKEKISSFAFFASFADCFCFCDRGLIVPVIQLAAGRLHFARIGIHRFCCGSKKQLIREERKRRKEKISSFAFFASFADCFCFCGFKRARP